MSKIESAAPKPSRPSPSRILIVDDEPNVLSVLMSLLSDEYDCVGAACAEDAIRHLRLEQYDLILSDIMMPGMNGLELVDQVRGLAPETVVVLVSGNLDIRVAIEALRLGAYDYVTKPFDLCVVESAVQRALRHQALLAANRKYEQHMEELISVRSGELIQANRSLETAVEKLYVNYRATLRGLAMALEARDVETRGHSDRVAAYSVRLGNQLALDDRDMVALECGALLHDLGKIGVPDRILFKQGPLTNEEWVLMKAHVNHGARILSGVEFLTDAAKVVCQHHEKYDGTGYLRGLAGNEIYIGARIFAVADAIDAFTSDRPYRAGRPYEALSEELNRCAGSHFDPTVVEAFEQVPLDEWKEIRRLVSASQGAALGSGLKKKVVASFLSIRQETSLPR